MILLSLIPHLKFVQSTYRITLYIPFYRHFPVYKNKLSLQSLCAPLINRIASSLYLNTQPHPPVVIKTMLYTCLARSYYRNILCKCNYTGVPTIYVIIIVKISDQWNYWRPSYYARRLYHRWVWSLVLAKVCV